MVISQTDPSVYGALLPVVVVVVAELAVVGDVLELGLVCAEHSPAMPRDNAARATMFSFFVVIMLSSFDLGFIALNPPARGAAVRPAYSDIVTVLAVSTREQSSQKKWNP
jgi:hypothetical protein